HAERLEPGHLVGIDAHVLAGTRGIVRAVPAQRGGDDARGMPAADLEHASRSDVADHRVEDLRVAGPERGVVEGERVVCGRAATREGGDFLFEAQALEPRELAGQVEIETGE